MTISAVTFDLYFTLIWEDRQLAEYHNSRKVMAIYKHVKPVIPTLKPQNVQEAFARVTKILRQQGRVGEVHPKEQVRMILQELGHTDFEQDAIERMALDLSMSGLDRLPNLNPEAPAALSALKDQLNLKLGIISNVSRSKEAYSYVLERLGIGRFFNAMVFSSEVGAAKPKREVFQRTLALLGVQANQALHVGDSYATDVTGAKAAGMKAVLYTGLWKQAIEYYGSEGYSLSEEGVPGVISISSLLELPEIVANLKP